MQQPTITSFYKSKKRPIQSPEERLKATKQLAAESNRVQFVKKGNLSPVKKKNEDKVDLKRLKAVARNFKDSQNKLEKLREQRKLLSKTHHDARKNESSKVQEGPTPNSEIQTQTLPKVADQLTESISVTAHPDLQLPVRFRVLKMLNDGMNSVASMFQNRCETITFNKLKPAVESMTKHTFSLKSVARMLTIDDYFKVVTDKVDNVNQYVLEFRVKLLPSMLVRLRKNFESRLLQFCLIEHEKFLKSQNIEVDRRLVTRWHPSFNIEAVQIPAIELPVLKQKLSSAADVLIQVRELVHGKNPVMLSPVKNKPPTVKELKGISSSLLEKIREREKNRVVRSLTIPQEEIKLQKMKCRLPEMTRIIHNIFVGEKKAAIESPLFMERLQYSYGALTPSEIETHVNFLVKSQPEWIQKIKSTTSYYFKINKEIQISNLKF